MSQQSYLKKSTTLFPQRIVDSPVLNNDGAGDGDAINGVRSSDKNRHRGGKVNESWLSAVKSEMLSESTHIKSGCELSPSSSSSSPQKNKASVKKPLVECFTCNQMIKIERISEHLLFGGVKCQKCSSVFKDCQSFQSWTCGGKSDGALCEHILHYTVDPLESIKKHLSNHHLENGAAGMSFDISRHLKSYMNKMKSVKHEFPWQHALLQFKKSLQNSDSCILRPASKKLEKYKETGNERSVPTSKVKKEASKGGCSPIVSQDYEKSEIENDFLKTNEGFPKIASPDSKMSKKKRKGVWGTAFCKKKTSASRQSKSTDYVETPSDGFYYVVRHSITECPNCYGVIKPPDYTVNIVTFLMTAICSGCGLTIYIVHDPPDDSAPRVCIVTDQKAAMRKENTVAQNKKFSHKSLPEAVMG